MRLLEGRDILGEDTTAGAGLSAEAENFLEKKILEILAKAKAQQGRATEQEVQPAIDFHPTDGSTAEPK